MLTDVVATDEHASRIHFFHAALEQWLTDPEITIACGRWTDGALAELMPRGQAQLLPARYEGRFTGVRELRITGHAHHLHIDLGRVHKFRFVVAPSVCLAFKPSFEMRLLTVGLEGNPTDHWVISLMLSAPYRGDRLDHAAVVRYFRRAQAHAAQRPDLIEIGIEPDVRASDSGPSILAVLHELTGDRSSGWDQALHALLPGVLLPIGAAASQAASPECLPLLREAIALRDASLVIFRDRTLVEFKTERLGGLHRYEEAGHVSWQIGALDDHHCHLALGAVHRVLFSAEPVPCQGGGLNYTVWFLTPGASGNPYRRDGYFSVVLNRPYAGNAARLEVIQPVLDLYRRFRDQPWVEADATFLEVIEKGAPARTAPSDVAPARAD